MKKYLFFLLAVCLAVTSFFLLKRTIFFTNNLAIYKSDLGFRVSYPKTWIADREGSSVYFLPKDQTTDGRVRMDSQIQITISRDEQTKEDRLLLNRINMPDWHLQQLQLSDEEALRLEAPEGEQVIYEIFSKKHGNFLIFTIKPENESVKALLHSFHL